MKKSFSLPTSIPVRGCYGQLCGAKCKGLRAVRRYLGGSGYLIPACAFFEGETLRQTPSGMARRCDNCIAAEEKQQLENN